MNIGMTIGVALIHLWILIRAAISEGEVAIEKTKM